MTEEGLKRILTAAHVTANFRHSPHIVLPYSLESGTKDTIRATYILALLSRLKRSLSAQSLEHASELFSDIHNLAICNLY